MSDNEIKEKETEDGEASTDEEEQAKKGLNIKKILIIVVPVILLLGGGAGAYFLGLLDGLLGKKPVVEGTEHAEGEQAAEEESGGSAGGEHGGTVISGPTFLKVADEKGQDLVVNLSSPDGQMRFLQLGVQLELKNPGDAEKIKAVMPRVIDQFQTYLRELRLKDLRGSAGIYRLQMELLARVNQAAAPVQVKDVLFEKILIQ